MKRMRNGFRRALTLLLAMLFLLALALPAAADEMAPAETEPTTTPAETAPPQADPYEQAEEKTVTFTDAGEVVMEPAEQAAFWEYPLLKAGVTRRAGTLRLVNASSRTVDFRLSSFGLPYGNTAALTYLGKLRITVSEGDTVLYDGSYSHIADPDGLQIVMEDWEPGSERVLTIQLRCGFDYAGTPEEDSVPMSWGFAVSYDEGENPLSSSPDLTTPRPTTAVTIICIAVGLVVICSVAGTVGVMLRRKRNRKPPEDADRGM